MRGIPFALTRARDFGSRTPNTTRRAPFTLTGHDGLKISSRLIFFLYDPALNQNLGKPKEQQVLSVPDPRSKRNPRPAFLRFQ